MKNLTATVILIISIIAFTTLTVKAQFIVKHVTGPSVNTAQDGFFYSLPLTVLKVNLVYEKIDQKKGPLADYTKEFLGTSDYINSNNTIFRMVNVTVTPEIVPDPDQRYYVQFPAQRDKDQKPMSFILDASGILLSFDESETAEKLETTQNIDQTYILNEGEKEFSLEADYNRKKQLDTITRRITIDTVSIDRFIFKTTWVDKSDEDKANEAAMQIAKIREGRYNLLTGYQEVDYGKSMQYMDQQLKKMEKQYLELFLGKESKTIESQSVYYIPKKGKNNDQLLDLGEGFPVKINIKPGNTTENLPDKPLEKVDNVYYRVPDFAIVEVIFNDVVYLRKKITINQLGIVTTAPVNRTKSQYDPQTGSLRKIVRE